MVQSTWHTLAVYRQSITCNHLQVSPGTSVHKSEHHCVEHLLSPLDHQPVTTNDDDLTPQEKTQSSNDEIANGSTATIVSHDNVDPSLQKKTFDDADEQTPVAAINWINLLSDRVDVQPQWDEISTDGLFVDNSELSRLSRLSVNSSVCGSLWSWPTPLVTPRGELHCC